MSASYTLIRPYLMRMDPERAHALTLRVLASGLFPFSRNAGRTITLPSMLLYGTANSPTPSVWPQDSIKTPKRSADVSA